MTGYCQSCGAPIHGNFKFCSMCSGDPWQPSDDYAQQEMERQEMERQEHAEQERREGDRQKEEK